MTDTPGLPQPFNRERPDSRTLADLAKKNSPPQASALDARLAARVKTNFIAFLETLDLLPDQKTKVIEAGNSVSGKTAVSDVLSTIAMRDKLLSLRPDLEKLVAMNYPDLEKRIAAYYARSASHFAPPTR
jgi:hypothetical protein